MPTGFSWFDWILEDLFLTITSGFTGFYRVVSSFIGFNKCQLVY